MDNNRFDVLVIGEGLAGVTAAAAAVKAGARVGLVSAGPGTFALGAGTVDLKGMYSEEQGGNEQHSVPFLEEAIGFYKRMTVSAGCDYKGNLSGRRLLPTVMGAFQGASLAPFCVWQGDPSPGTTVVVVGIDGLADFDANYVAERLTYHAHQMGIRTNYQAYTVKLPWQRQRGVNALEIAQYIDRNEGFRIKLIEILRPLTHGSDLLLLPGLLGIRAGVNEITRFEQRLGCPVCELPTLPPSVIGLRLFQHLEAYLKKAGVAINAGFPVASVILEKGCCSGVIVDTPGRGRPLRADAVILATGDPIKSLLNQPEIELGKGKACVNADLQPLDRNGSVIADNLFVAGSILENCNLQNGNGMAILSGYRAGTLAAEVGGYHAEA